MKKTLALAVLGVVACCATTTIRHRLGAGPPATIPLPYAYPPQGPFYLSTMGSDSTGDGSSGNPWRNPQKAVDYIRANHLNATASQDIAVNFAPGSYAPYAMGAADSGFNGHGIVHRCTGSPGACIIEAGVAVTGWTLYSGSIWKATVPNQFWTLYENDVRATSARYPKLVITPGFPCARAGYNISVSDTVGNVRLKYNPSDFPGGTDPAGLALADIGLEEWSGGGWEWATDRQPLASVDATNHLLNFVNKSKFPVWNTQSFVGIVGSRYFVEGALPLLTQAGEWYLDRNTLTLYYWPMSTPITSQTIVIPTALEGIAIEGTSGNPGARVENVTIDGLAVKHTDFLGSYWIGGWPVTSIGNVAYPVPSPWATGQFYAWLAQQPFTMVGAIHLRDTRNVTVTNAHVMNAGTAGILIDDYAQQDQITNSLIEQTGAAGIRFDGRFPGLGDVNNNNTVRNFKIHDVGQLAGAAGGIDVGQSGSNTFQYGYIYNGPRHGMWLFATTGQTDISTIYTKGNLVDHVKFEFLGQDSGEMGALNFDSLSGVTPKLVINTAQQVIINSIHVHPSVRDSPPGGILSDDQTDGQILTNIQVTNVDGPTYQHNADTTVSTLTNTSFNFDGTVNGSFNAGLMDTANIGTLGSCGSISPPCFPY